MSTSPFLSSNKSLISSNQGTPPLVRKRSRSSSLTRKSPPKSPRKSPTKSPSSLTRKSPTKSPSSLTRKSPTKSPSSLTRKSTTKSPPSRITLHIYAHGQEAIYFNPIKNQKYIPENFSIPEYYSKNDIQEVTPEYIIYKLQPNDRRNIRIFSCAGSCGNVNLAYYRHLFDIHNKAYSPTDENTMLAMQKYRERVTPKVLNYFKNINNYYPAPRVVDFANKLLKKEENLCRIYYPIIDKRYRFYDRDENKLNLNYFIKIEDFKDVKDKELFTLFSVLKKEKRHLFTTFSMIKFQNYFEKTKNTYGLQLVLEILSQEGKIIYSSQIIRFFRALDIEIINILDYSCRASHHDTDMLIDDKPHAQYDKMLEIVKETNIPEEEGKPQSGDITNYGGHGTHGPKAGRTPTASDG
jgi:hypothetical protein